MSEQKQTELKQDMAANVQVLYPEYCAILQKEAEVKGYHRGYQDKIASYEDHIDQQAVLIDKLTVANKALYAKNKQLTEYNTALREENMDLKHARKRKFTVPQSWIDAWEKEDL